MERVRQALAYELGLLDEVEAAAVEEPDLPLHPLASARRWLEVPVEPVEEQRVPHPHDRGDHVDPASHEVEELEKSRRHRQALRLRPICVILSRVPGRRRADEGSIVRAP
jgi:hypothetical protein